MPGHGRAGSHASDNSNAARLEPKLLKAVEADDLHRVQEILKEAQVVPRPRQHLLEIGLTRACEKRNVRIGRYLLSWSANPNYISQSKQPNISRAADWGFTDIVAMLIDAGANPETKDKKGRTALMTAAWKGHFDIVRLLLDHRADINTLDHRDRNVLHNIAADKNWGKSDDFTQPRCGMDIIDHLLQTGLNLDARDELGRTPLHWSCVTDNEKLVLRLLQTRLNGGAAKADTNATDGRMKTPLHLVASHNRPHLARLLLNHGADVHARSDGGWTSLHNACEEGSLELIGILVSAGADVNSELLNGRTPLHVAAEKGNITAVCYLLEQPNIKRITKDRFGNTPLLLAAQRRRKEIVEMLAPWKFVDALSSDEQEASELFDATMVDFGHFRNENRVTKRSVFELLYGRDKRDPTKHAVSTLPKNIKATNFRWIHLPANNVAWCDALLTKRFIEEGATDVEGYKALEASFAHQHRGHRHHSRFMRPMCQVVQRTPPESEGPSFVEKDERSQTPAGFVQEPATLPSIPASPTSSPSSSKATEMPKTGRTKPQSQTSESTVAGAAQNKTLKDRQKTKNGMNGAVDPGRAVRQAGSRQQSKSSAEVAASNALKRNASNNCNIYMFMPYLHFETDKRRQEMQTATKNAGGPRTDTLATKDEMLIRAYLTASSSFLHVRRTLDQFFYHNIDTHQRDCDQVVYRFQINNRPGQDVDPKIYMVDQLWMWILGKDLIVTAFPQRWDQPRNDPLNVLEGIIEDINSRTREPVQNVYELAMVITGRCYGAFDRHRKADEEFQFFDMFEASIGSAMHNEASLFSEFKQASRQASAWLQHHQRPNRFTRALNKESTTQETDVVQRAKFAFDDRTHGLEPLFVDKLLDVGAETDLLAEIKDIRDELDIIKMVLDHQHHMMPELKNAIQDIYKDERSHGQVRKVDKVYDEQEKTIVNPLKDISRMDKQAERIYTNIRDLLDLKQKHANAFEARFARDQAAGTVRQGRTIMVFTVVTVIFLPLSFIASIFAINVTEFPHTASGTPALSLAYISEYIFGIGLAISIPCIVLALTVDEVSYFVGESRQRVHKLWLQWKARSRKDPQVELQLQAMGIAQRLSVDKRTRKSMEENWTSLALEVRSRNTAARWDVERGH